jgi:hypothetical protein
MTINGIAHLQAQFLNDTRIVLIGDVNDIGIAKGCRAARASPRQAAYTTGAAGLIRADEVVTSMRKVSYLRAQ